MFNTRLIREEDALLQLESLSWLIRTYGPPRRPSVPSPLHKSSQICDFVMDPLDTRSVFVWAEDMFVTIKRACEMEGQNIQLAPISQALTDNHAANFGASDVVFYDPSRCEEPGYFAGMALMQLAELRSLPFQPEAGLSPLMQGMLVLACGAYNAQGISLACLVPDVSDYLTSENDTKKVPFRVIENTLCFAVCLNLMVLRQSPEQIVATYGSIMPQSFRRKIRSACRQIEGFEQELKLLQILSEPKGDQIGWGPRHTAQSA